MEMGCESCKNLILWGMHPTERVLLLPIDHAENSPQRWRTGSIRVFRAKNLDNKKRMFNILAIEGEDKNS